MDAKLEIKLNMWCTNFLEIQEPPQNSKDHDDDMKQVPYSGSTNVRSHSAKFSCHSNLASKISAFLFICIINVLFKGICIKLRSFKMPMPRHKAMR
jgi:hypothetical protein